MISDQRSEISDPKNNFKNSARFGGLFLWDEPEESRYEL
jgi:hypothetical protein